MGFGVSLHFVFGAAAMRTTIVAQREILGLDSKAKRKSDKVPQWRSLLLCIPFILTLWALLIESSLITPRFMVEQRISRALEAAESAVSALDGVGEDLEGPVEFNASSLYPDEMFDTDWSKYIDSDKILHLNSIHRGCITHKDSIIPWSFGKTDQTRRHEREELVHRNDPQLLDKLRQCPDVDIFLPEGLRNFGYCEDAAAYTKFLKSRMLPRWVLEVKFEDTVAGKSVTYHDLCPKTPMLFFNHYWDGVPKEADWPEAKPLYLMPNIEMYELESEHYWRADVILCKTALCARYLRQWFRQEGNPRGTRVLYTRHTTSNLALELRRGMDTSVMARKNFSDVTFLHTAGKSIQKGTRQVLDCWLSRPEFPMLKFYIDQDLYQGAFSDYDGRIESSTNVQIYTGRLTPREFGRVISEGRYFLCPSMMEGYGHYINQARSSNAYIITTDAAPMNELVTPSSGALVPARVLAYGEQFMGGLSDKPHALRNVSGLVASFENYDVCEVVEEMLASTTADDRARAADQAFQQYYFDTVFFEHKMNELRDFARSHGHHYLRREADT